MRRWAKKPQLILGRARLVNSKSGRARRQRRTDFTTFFVEDKNFGGAAPKVQYVKYGSGIALVWV